MEDVERREPDGGDEREGAGPCSVTCSVCLDPVSPDSVNRSVATLRCRHKFHLDCIGSAFNVKGMMRCPNCREVEKGRWLYGNGRHRSDRRLRDYGERPLRNGASSSRISDLEARTRRSRPGGRAREPIRLFQLSGPFPVLAITAHVVNAYVSPAWFALCRNHSHVIPRAHHLPIFPQNRRRLYPWGRRLGGQSSVNLVEQRSLHWWQIGYGTRHYHHLYQHPANHVEEGSSFLDGGYTPATPHSGRRVGSSG